MGSAEQVLAEHVESVVPTLLKRRAAGLIGEPLDQVVAGIDVGQRCGGMGAAVGDPLMSAVGPKDLGQSREPVLNVRTEP